MIHIVTSTTLSESTLRTFARKLAKKEGGRVVTFKRVPWNHGAEQGDALIAAQGNDGSVNVPVVCPTDSEMLILRVGRRVREGALAPEAVVFHVLTRGQVRPGVVGTSDHVIPIDQDGEFKELWPDGLFEGRMSELY